MNHTKKSFLLANLLLLAASITASAQLAQPAITSPQQIGGQRGANITFTVEGLNLSGATELIWDRPGVSAKIAGVSEESKGMAKVYAPSAGKAAFIDSALRNKVQVEAAIATTAAPGIYRFRLKTPLGTTNTKTFVVTPFVEIASNKTNQSLAVAQTLALPATVVGGLERNGEADHFKFHARAGQTIVFEVIAAATGSKLNSVLTLMDTNGNALASNDDFKGRFDSLIGHEFKQDGDYILRLTDLENRGAPGQYTYRINIGEFAYVTEVFPLGVRQGSVGKVTLSGFNLAASQVRISAPAKSTWGDTIVVKSTAAKGEPLNNAIVAVDQYPEIVKSGSNDSIALAQSVALPVTINGKLANAPEDFYRFTARKGQKLMIEVAARRYGSRLDSEIEVLDAKGAPIERATLRCLLETNVTFRDHDSDRYRIRVHSWNGFAAGDDVLIGEQLLKLMMTPKTPDDDFYFVNLNEERIGMLGTTPTALANNTPIYKVAIYPPGTSFPPNGLPVVHLFYTNDDAGPQYGAGRKDSLLDFTAPADGDYIVRLRDVRNIHSDDLAYRLSIHEPQPDFALSLSPENPNVPAGGTRAITAVATRIDGFDGEIEVKLANLPAGFTATTGHIRAGELTAEILLSATPDARESFGLRADGTATINGAMITRPAQRGLGAAKDEIAPASSNGALIRTAGQGANGLKNKVGDNLSVVSVAPAPDILLSTEQRQIPVEAGGNLFVTLKVKRQNGFEGRIPIELRSLPLGFSWKEAGNNGIMITERDETQRFEMVVEPWVKPGDYQFFIIGKIETSSPQTQEYPALPVTISVKPKDTASR